MFEHCSRSLYVERINFSRQLDPELFVRVAACRQLLVDSDSESSCLSEESLAGKGKSFSCYAL